jgi:hypothetical protein
MLHLKLRKTDKLNENFIDHLQEKSREVKDYVYELDEEIKCPLVGRLYDFLCKECKIPKPISVKMIEGKKTYVIRDFRGLEQTRFYNQLCRINPQTGEYAFNLSTLFPELPKIKNIDSLYKKFYYIYTRVKQNAMEAADIKHQTHEWLELFVSTYDEKRVTPYMHIFVHHLHEFKSLDENINDYNQEGHEKFNDLCTTKYFRATNHQITDNKAIRQLFEKFNRLELFDLGYEMNEEVRIMPPVQVTFPLIQRPDLIMSNEEPMQVDDRRELVIVTELIQQPRLELQAVSGHDIIACSWPGCSKKFKSLSFKRHYNSHKV